jgi:hypothetical protein
MYTWLLGMALAADRASPSPDCLPQSAGDWERLIEVDWRRGNWGSIEALVKDLRRNLPCASDVEPSFIARMHQLGAYASLPGCAELKPDDFDPDDISEPQARSLELFLDAYRLGGSPNVDLRVTGCNPVRELALQGLSQYPPVTVNVWREVIIDGVPLGPGAVHDMYSGQHVVQYPDEPTLNGWYLFDGQLESGPGGRPVYTLGEPPPPLPPEPPRHRQTLRIVGGVLLGLGVGALAASPAGCAISPCNQPAEDWDQWRRGTTYTLAMGGAGLGLSGAGAGLILTSFRKPAASPATEPLEPTFISFENL